jgi:hypothetical protein
MVMEMEAMLQRHRLTYLSQHGSAARVLPSVQSNRPSRFYNYPRAWRVTSLVHVCFYFFFFEHGEGSRRPPISFHYCGRYKILQKAPYTTLALRI